MKQLHRPIYVALAVLALGTTPASAQDDWGSLGDAFGSSWDEFVAETDAAWEAFRDSCNAAFANLLEQTWKDFTPQGVQAPPKDNGISTEMMQQMALPPEIPQTPPTNAFFAFDAIVDAVDNVSAKAIKPLFKKKTKKQKAAARAKAKAQAQQQTQQQNDPFASFGTAVPTQQPRQQASAKPAKGQAPAPAKWLKFTVYGTEMQVNIGDITEQLRLADTQNTTVANAWRLCSTPQYKELIDDCLQLKDDYQLCDWAYLQALRAMGDAYFGQGSNESTFITAYIFSQSGFRMRLGAANGKLVMLYGTQHTIFGKPAWRFDAENFYALNVDIDTYMPVNACPAAMEQEESMSLLVPAEPKLTADVSTNHVFQAYRDKSFRISVDVNQNLMSFFESYPSSRLGDNQMSRWIMLANTPLDSMLCAQLYPELRKRLAGRSKRDQVAALLDLVQGFTYKLDEERWGYDRAFFSEETLFYDVSDCEDHAILFSRLVRDLVGLPVALVHYENPGHLAAAVRFDESDGVQGDYMQLGTDRFYITDPTYAGAGIGRTMPVVKRARTNIALLQ